MIIEFIRDCSGFLNLHCSNEGLRAISNLFLLYFIVIRFRRGIKQSA